MKIYRAILEYGHNFGDPDWNDCNVVASPWYNDEVEALKHIPGMFDLINSLWEQECPNPEEEYSNINFYTDGPHLQCKEADDFLTQYKPIEIKTMNKLFKI